MMMIAIATALAAGAPDSSVSQSQAVVDEDKLAWAAGLGFAFGVDDFNFSEPFRAFVERRFGDRFWLGVGAEAGVAAARLDQTGSPTSTTIGLGGSGEIEGRVMANPGEALEIGALGDVALGMQGEIGGGDAMVGDASLGVLVQHWFTPQLAVRLSSSVLHVGGSYEGVPGQGSSTSINAGVLFEPALAAVIAF
jgi:hypothetical protein